MLPTLVFTLVLAGILRDRFDVRPDIFGGLIIYTIGSTILPGILLGGAPPRWDAPELDDAPETLPRH